MTTETKGALEGIRILDFTQMMMGPFGIQILADLGADVIKIERQKVGEWLRSMPMVGEFVGGDSAAFLSMNRNKRSVTANFKHPEGRKALLELAKTCDVVTENFRPGVMKRLGLGYEDFREVKPDIIYVSGSGWGQDSELAKLKRPGQDLLVQAMAGVMFNTGRATDPPTPQGTPIADIVGGYSFANAVMAGVLARNQHGIGQWVEVDLYSSLLASMCQELFTIMNQDVDLTRSQAGLASTWNDAPYGVYPTQDGWVAIAMIPLDKLGILVGDPTLGDLDAWVERDKVKWQLEEATKKKDTAEWMTIFVEADVWAAPVRTPEEAMQELQDMNSDLLVKMDHPKGGLITAIGCPIKMGETPATLRYVPPQVGEHTAEIFQEVLGEEKAQALLDEGVIG
ncbi:MAG: CoA transferase [Pseudomonadota bacterium]